MGWLHSLLSPLKKLWGTLRSTKRTRKFNQIRVFFLFSYAHSLTMYSFLVLGRGIYVLYEDVKSCSCEDVHALWTLLVDSDAKFA